MSQTEHFASYRRTLKKSFQTKYREKRDSWSTEPVQREVSETFRDWIGVPPRCILDIGCGVGRDVIKFAEAGHVVTGIDIVSSDRWTEIASLYTEQVRFHTTYLQDFLPEFGFDCIVDNGCLHHQAPSEIPPYLLHCSRLLSPGGHLLLSVFDDDAPRGSRIDPDGRVDINFEPAGLEQLLNDAGFNITATRSLQRARQPWRYRLLMCKRIAL